MTRSNCSSKAFSRVFNEQSFSGREVGGARAVGDELEARSFFDSNVLGIGARTGLPITGLAEAFGIKDGERYDKGAVLGMTLPEPEIGDADGTKIGDEAGLDVGPICGNGGVTGERVAGEEET